MSPYPTVVASRATVPPLSVAAILAIALISSSAQAQQPPPEVPPAAEAAPDTATAAPGAAPDTTTSEPGATDAPTSAPSAAQTGEQAAPDPVEPRDSAAQAVAVEDETAAPGSAEASLSAEADAAADAEAALLAEAFAESGEDTGRATEHSLELYGFADFSYGHAFHTPLGIRPWDSFSVGNLNLYIAAELGDNWRSLAEVRFMYLPHGAINRNAAFEPELVSTETTDYTDLGRTVKTGGISIERAWVEYSPHPLLTVRGGQWLTPYGIWNVDHGSPVIVGVRRPFIVGDFLFPDRQTGLQLYGSASIGSTRIGYHLTLSNGRGPIDAYQDLNDNKAIGGRLYATNESQLGTVTLGSSFYRGKYTDRGVESGAGFDATYPRTSEYDELSLAADLKWEFKGLLVQSEIITNEVSYAEELRPVAFGSGGGPPGFTPDNRRWGFYALTGYRFPFLGIMPFFGGERYSLGKHSFIPTSAAFWGGLNVRPTPRVVFKTQITHAWWSGDIAEMFKDKADPSAQLLDFQISWSF